MFAIVASARSPSCSPMCELLGQWIGVQVSVDVFDLPRTEACPEQED